jgi:hypothetical protein
MGPRSRATAVAIVLVIIYACVASARTGPAAVLATASDKYIIETKEASVSVSAAKPEAADPANQLDSVTTDEFDEEVSEAKADLRTAAASVAKHGKSSHSKGKHQKSMEGKPHGDDDAHDVDSSDGSDSSSTDDDTESSTDNDSSSDSASNSKSVKKAAKKHKSHESKAQKYPSYPVRQEEDHTTGKKGHGHHKDKAAKHPKVLFLFFSPQTT